MNVRRRVLVATIVLGVGFCSFQPIMRSRIESRLSEILGSEVRIGSSKISILDGTIALTDIVIDPKDKDQLHSGRAGQLPIIIANAALRFDWNSVAFRNFKIDNLVAADVHWQFRNPDAVEVPRVDVPSSQFNPGLLTSIANTQRHLESLNAFVQPIKRTMEEHASLQSQSQLVISSRLTSIEERLREAIPNDIKPNTLRPTLEVEDVKKELAMIRQAIAENAVNRRESEKTIVSMKHTLKQSFAKHIENVSDASLANIHQSAMQYAESAVAREWNRNRPAIYALLKSITQLEPEVPDASVVQTRSNSPTSAYYPIENLPKRFTQVVSARFRGKAHFERESNEKVGPAASFELQLQNISSQPSMPNDSPAATLSLNDISEGGNTQTLFCTAERKVIAQSAANSTQMLLQRTIWDGRTSTTKIQQANHGWVSTISLPTLNCMDSSMVDALQMTNDQSGLDLNQTITARLVAMSQVTAQTQASVRPQKNVLIEIDQDSTHALESALALYCQGQSAKLRLELETRGTELLNSELMKIGLRWDQLGDEHARTHNGWEACMEEYKQKLKQFELLSRRATRMSDTLVR